MERLSLIINRVQSRLENTPCETDTTILVDCHECQDREFVVVEQGGSYVAQRCKCQEQKSLNRIIKSSGLTSAQRKNRIGGYKATDTTLPLLRVVQRYIEEFPQIYASDNYGKGAALTGSVGIGKTMLATAIANELLDRKIPTVFVVTPDLMAELRIAQMSQGGADAEAKIDKLSKVAVCIFDDVAKEKPTEWVQMQYFRILDDRWKNKLPTCFTSNYSLDQIAGRLGENGDAIASRLYALTQDRQAYVRADDYRLKPRQSTKRRDYIG
ncbi:MAG: ATP-binding protein [Bacillota bacterium]